jgi:hypothetical protein
MTALNVLSSKTIAVLTKTVVTWLFIQTCVLAQNASSWPDLKLPKSLQLFSAGQNVVMNGLPMRMHVFVSTQSPAALSRSVEQSLGKPLVVNKLGEQIVLGRAQGSHFISIQIEPTSGGSRGVVAVSDLKTALSNKDVTAQEKSYWLQQLPVGTTLSSHIKSLDGLKQSQQLIYSNALDESFNRDRLNTILKADGMVFERETLVDEQAYKKTATAVQGRVLFFKGTNKEAMATMHRQPDGQTITVLNIINTMEKYK